MEKALKYERLMQATAGLMIGTILLAIFLEGYEFLGGFGAGLMAFASIIFSFAGCAIKELKRENESLKSVGSADTTDSTPPEDE